MEQRARQPAPGARASSDGCRYAAMLLPQPSLENVECPERNERISDNNNNKK
jgi:hypothetical protein